MNLYVVTTPGRPGALKVFVAAESEEAAVAEATRRGCGEPVVARVWEGASAGPFRAGACITCGYEMVDLPSERGWAVCPECGSRQFLR